MKTTLELPDDLLIEAKALAARRRTTLKAMIEHSLRREISCTLDKTYSQNTRYEIGENGLPRLKKRSGAPVTNAVIYQIMEEEGI